MTGFEKRIPTCKSDHIYKPRLNFDGVWYYLIVDCCICGWIHDGYPYLIKDVPPEINKQTTSAE